MSEEKDSTSGVYMIRCTVNGKVYIGSSADLLRREQDHRKLLRRGEHFSRHLQSAWNKYGPDAFEWSILERIPIDGLTVGEVKLALLGREQHHIDANDATRLGFNRRLKAESNLGIKHTAEARANNSAAQRGKKLSPEHAAKLAALALANKGKKRAPEIGAKVTAAKLGKKLSPEHIAKMSAARLGRKQSPEAIEKTASARRGTKLPEQHRARIAAGIREHWKHRRKNAPRKLTQGLLFE